MKLSRVFLALSVLAGLYWATGTASAQRSDDGWELIGTIRADLREGRAGKLLTDTRGRFNALRIYARRNNIRLSNIAVTYGNGSVHNERRPINLLQGERTRPINPGRSRFVDQMELVYQPRGNVSGDDRYAEIEIYGRRSGRRDDLVAERPGAPSSGGGSSSQPSRPSGGGGVIAAPSRPIGGGNSAGSIVPSNPQRIIASPAPAGRCGGPGEQFLGSRTVGFGVDRDRIQIGGQIGKFDLIRLCVYGNDVELLGTRVNFVEGEGQTLPYSGLIKADQRTQAMRFTGDRFLKDVEILYKKRDQFTGRARVEVWGEYAEGWLNGESDKYAGGWAILSTHTARFIGFDRDVAVVPKNRGGFRQVRVDVLDRDITLRRLTITYADGEKEDLVGERTKIEGNSSLGPIDLKGVRPVAIKEIEAVYRSRIFDAGAKGRDQAIVQIRGKR